MIIYCYMKRKIILFSIILIVVAGAGYYIWSDYKKIGPEENVSQPSLEREINITANIPEETKTMAGEKIEELRANLKENDDLRSSWLDLASYYKLVGDYAGAEEVWKYMASKSDTDFVPYYNLATLYAYYLKDFSKAEEYFNKAIEKNPNYIATYAAFYDFYINYEKPDLAKSVLERGLQANPGNEELTQLLQ